SSESDVDTFYAVPYAAPPVGSLRWAATKDADWTGLVGEDGVLDATSNAVQHRRFDDRCTQAADTGPVGGENCLHLRIHRPKGAHDAPVLVFLHGGAFTIGAGIDWRSEPLAKNTGMIVVNVNYRLGPLGFIGHPTLSAAAHKE